MSKLTDLVLLPVELFRYAVINLLHDFDNLNLEDEGTTLPNMSKYAGHEVRHYDMVVQKFGGWACCMDIPMAFCLKLDKNEYGIAVNTLFTEAPKYIQKAILMHEVGHIVSGHLEPGAAALVINGVIIDAKFEIEADKYAADKGVDMKRALKYIRTYARARGYRAIVGLCLDARISAL